MIKIERTRFFLLRLITIILLSITPIFIEFSSVFWFYTTIVILSLVVARLFIFPTFLKLPFRLTYYKIFSTLLVLYGILLVVATLARYYNMSSESIDVSYYYSAIKQLAVFKVPRIWDIPSRYVWGDHFEPILLLFVPFYWLKPDASILMLIQTATVISGIIPLYKIVLQKFNNRNLALALSFAYLLFGGLQMGYAYGFHPIVLFPTLFFWMYYFFEKKSIAGYLVFLLLTLAIKEEAALILFAFGLYTLIFRHRLGFSLLTLSGSFLWYWLCF
ncbi:MAG: DUF2079 domain-containing protein, partial [bacterium]|nr:DUF2079 domain-containing protein [bacterium]